MRDSGSRTKSHDKPQSFTESGKKVQEGGDRQGNPNFSGGSPNIAYQIGVAFCVMVNCLHTAANEDNAIETLRRTTTKYRITNSHRPNFSHFSKSDLTSGVSRWRLN